MDDNVDPHDDDEKKNHEKKKNTIISFESNVNVCKMICDMRLLKCKWSGSLTEEKNK